MTKHKHKRTLYRSPNATRRRRLVQIAKWKKISKTCEQTHNCATVHTQFPSVSLRTIQRHFQRYQNTQKNSTEYEHPALIDHRGQHRQVFTPAQEQQLANSIRNSNASGSTSYNYNTVRAAALSLYQTLHPHNTRTQCNFIASNGWCARFKARHNFASHQIKRKKKYSMFDNKISVVLSGLLPCDLSFGSNGVFV